MSTSTLSSSPSSSSSSSQTFRPPAERQRCWRTSGDSLASSVSSSSSLSICSSTSLAWGVKYPFMQCEMSSLLLHQDAPLFHGLSGGLERSRHHSALPIYTEQIYIVVNDPRLLENGKAHVFGPDGGSAFKIRASHGQHGGFVLVESFTDRELLMVTEVSRKFGLRHRNSNTGAPVIRKMVIRNLDLYDDVGRGEVLFSLDIGKDDRTMDITDSKSLARMQISGNLSDSATIQRGGERISFGEVGNLLGRFMEERSRFAFLLRSCSKEEAAVLLASSYAMFAHQNPDMKPRIFISKQHPTVGQQVKSRLSLDGATRRSTDASRTRRSSISTSTNRPFRRNTPVVSV